jgi:predicted nucleic acid-binding protein
LSNNKIVLDSYAIMAVIEDEPGAQAVADIISDDQFGIYMSAINLGEAYCILLREQGKQTAEEVVSSILLDDSFKVQEASWQRIKSAATIKSKGGLSYADAFVLGLALEMQAAIVTGDPEIRTAAQPDLQIIWIGK